SPGQLGLNRARPTRCRRPNPASPLQPARSLSTPEVANYLTNPGTPSLPQSGPQVLGADLNCSESRRRRPAPQCASTRPEPRFQRSYYGGVAGEFPALLAAGAAMERHVDPPPCFARGWQVELRLD